MHIVSLSFLEGLGSDDDEDLFLVHLHIESEGQNINKYIKQVDIIILYYLKLHGSN